MPRQHKYRLSMSALSPISQHRLGTQNDSSDVATHDEYRSRLMAFYWAHDANKISSVDKLLAQHQGREESLLERIHRDYGVRDYSGDVATDDIYEHERYSYLYFSWGSSFPGHLLPTDRSKWSTRHGSPSSQTFEAVAPQLPDQWQWTSEWEVDKSTPNCDADGWIYAFDFPRMNLAANQKSGKRLPASTDYVRRRRWIRQRSRVPDASEAKKSTLTTDNTQQEGLDTPVESKKSTSMSSNEKVSPLQVPFKYYSMDMSSKSLDSVWKSTLNELESLYTDVETHTKQKREQWKHEKARIGHQIRALEKNMESMKLLLAQQQGTKHSSSPNRSERFERFRNGLRMPSPEHRQQRRHESEGLNPQELLAHIRTTQAKLDALRREYWHPKAKGYTLRFSIDGIFFGVKTFQVESLKTSFFVQLSHMRRKEKMESKIIPTCSVVMKGRAVACGKHVKVVGERGTRVPKSLWEKMSVDTEFTATIELHYSTSQDGIESGQWEFATNGTTGDDMTKVELIKFSRRVFGGLDLPESVVRKLCTDVLTSVLRNLVMQYVPPELAMAFATPPGKLHLEGEIEIQGASIDDLNMEMELVPAVWSWNEKQKSVAKVAKELLGLSAPQLNLLLMLGKAGISPSAYRLHKVASISDYLRKFGSIKDDGREFESRLETAWEKLLELVYIRQMRSRRSATDVPTDPPGVPLSLLSVPALFMRIKTQLHHPSNIQLTLHQLHCSWQMSSVFQAFTSALERGFLGVDLRKPRAAKESFLYGVRFGRKDAYGRQKSSPTKTSTSGVESMSFFTSGLFGSALSTEQECFGVSQVPMTMDEAFRERLRVFSKTCRMLSTVLEKMKANVRRATGELRGVVCEGRVSGKMKDGEYVGPINLVQSIPQGIGGTVQVETVSASDGRVGVKLNLLSLHDKQMKSFLHSTLFDVSSKMMLDTKAVMENFVKDQTPASVEVFSFNIHSTTGNEGKVQASLQSACAPFVSFESKVQEGTFSAELLLIYKAIVQERVMPALITAFPEHKKLLLMAEEALCGQLESTEVRMQFRLLTSVHHNEESSDLIGSVCGTHQGDCFEYNDVLYLVDVVERLDTMMNSWIDARCPLYARPT